MKPSIIPRIKWPNLVIYIPSAVVGYAVYLVVLLMLVKYGFQTHPIGVIQMIENIDTFVLALAVAIPVVWALVMSFTRFIGNKKDIMVAEKKAKLNGDEVVDPVNAQLADKYFLGYAVIGILGALVCAGLALFIGDILAGRGYIIGEEEVAFVTIAIAFVLEIIADYKVCNNLGDVALFIGKEKKAIDAFLHPAADAGEEEVKADKDPTQVLVEQLVAALQNGKKR